MVGAWSPFAKQTQTTEFTDLRPTSLPTDWSLVGATADLMLAILEPLRLEVTPPRDRGWGSHTVVAVAGHGRAGRSVACHDEEEEDANPRRAGEGGFGRRLRDDDYCAEVWSCGGDGSLLRRGCPAPWMEGGRNDGRWRALMAACPRADVEEVFGELHAADGREHVRAGTGDADGGERGHRKAGGRPR
jgi:hypothetical protein